MSRSPRSPRPAPELPPASVAPVPPAAVPVERAVPPRVSASRMQDVASLAGVSLVTVSRALNTPDKVSQATRERIAAAVARVGYVPNLVAGSLASSRSRTVAAIVPTIGSSTFSDTVQGLSTLLSSRGYQLLLGQTGYAESVEDELIEAFLGRRVDGIVLTGVNHSRHARNLLVRAGVPVVETWDLTPSPIDRVVGFSNFDAGRVMTDYLIDRGYPRIAYVGGADDRSARRREGWRAALDASRGADGLSVAVAAPSSLLAGQQALDDVLARDPRTAAIFFSNDVLAFGALLECQRRGWQVPARIAIAGFTDVAMAALFNPSLTTVHVRGLSIGQRAGQQLLARIEDQPLSDAIEDVGFEIMARDSA